jgi:hypothetical protein
MLVIAARLKGLALAKKNGSLTCRCRCQHMPIALQTRHRLGFAIACIVTVLLGHEKPGPHGVATNPLLSEQQVSSIGNRRVEGPSPLHRLPECAGAYFLTDPNVSIKRPKSGTCDPGRAPYPESGITLFC